MAVGMVTNIQGDILLSSHDDQYTGWHLAQFTCDQYTGWYLAQFTWWPMYRVISCSVHMVTNIQG